MFVGAPRRDEFTFEHMVNLAPDHKNSGHGEGKESDSKQGYETENWMIDGSDRQRGCEVKKD